MKSTTATSRSNTWSAKPPNWASNCPLLELFLRNGVGRSYSFNDKDQRYIDKTNTHNK